MGRSELSGPFSCPKKSKAAETTLAISACGLRNASVGSPSSQLNQPKCEGLHTGTTLRQRPWQERGKPANMCWPPGVDTAFCGVSPCWSQRQIKQGPTLKAPENPGGCVLINWIRKSVIENIKLISPNSGSREF